MPIIPSLSPMDQIKNSARRMLEGNIVPFWLNLMDRENGGFYGYMGYDLQIDQQAEKGCILNSRILWFFSEAAMFFEKEEKAADAENKDQIAALAKDCRKAADHAYAFLKDCCIDREYGGIYWSMTYDGQPLDTTKHTYNQAFACYALGAYFRLSGGKEALTLAREIFEVIETRCTDDIGYLEAFTRDWGPESNEKLSENGVLADKTMNTLLHVIEGYAGLYEAELTAMEESHRAKLEEAMRKAFRIYQEKVFSPELRRNLVFFDAEYNSILDLYSYGHDVESSWLVDWAADLLQDQELSENIHRIDSVLAQHVFEDAFDGHSLANECDRGKVDETRIWWVQAETVLGFLNEWKKNRDPKFLEAAASAVRYIEEVMVDPREGSEWFWSIEPDGKPTVKPIVEPWKCPYHNGRFTIRAITLF